VREVVLARDADPIKYDFFVSNIFLVSNPITHINVIRGGNGGVNYSVTRFGEISPL